MQDGHRSVKECLEHGDLERASIPENEKALLRFVQLLTQQANQCTADQVQVVCNAGWNDKEIAEAVYITAIFNMFNRVADAFGLGDSGYDKMDASTFV